MSQLYRWNKANLIKFSILLFIYYLKYIFINNILIKYYLSCNIHFYKWSVHLFDILHHIRILSWRYLYVMFIIILNYRKFNNHHLNNFKMLIFYLKAICLNVVSYITLKHCSSKRIWFIHFYKKNVQYNYVIYYYCLFDYSS